MKYSIVSGTVLAIAAIALAMSGASITTAAAKKATKSVECMGINACKGQSACKSASNACKVQNSCKGQGWLPAKAKAACEAKGGTVG